MINLIKRLMAGCLIALAVLLLIIIGIGGMLLDLLGAAAGGLLGMAAIGTLCRYMEDE